jgi:hypothetical protein
VLIGSQFVILSVLMSFVTADYPMVGMDYGYFLPRLVDNFLYRQVNSLGIQWFTPSFGGGVPAFPNPQDLQMTLPALLIRALGPWHAACATLVVMASIGALALAFTLRRGLGLGWPAAALGTSVFAANGYYLQHAGVGHMNFALFPLTALLLALLGAGPRRRWPAAVAVGIVVAMFPYSGGFYEAIVAALSLALTVPLVRLLAPSRLSIRRAMQIAVAGGTLGAAIGAAKLTSVFHMLEIFPRTMAYSGASGWLSGLKAISVQLLGYPTLRIANALTGGDSERVPAMISSAAGPGYGLWETDIFVSPIVPIIGMVYLASRLLGKKTSPQQVKSAWDTRRWALLASLGVALLITISLTIGRGPFFELTKPLPVFRSLHVNPRFASALILPLAVLSAYWLERVVVTRARAQLASCAGVVMTCLFYATYTAAPPSDSHLARTFDASPTVAYFDHARTVARPPEIGTIIPLRDEAALVLNASSWYARDNLYGYRAEHFRTQLTPGSIWSVHNGRYNMTYPVSLVYPKRSGLQPFDRFTLAQRETLARFVRRERFAFPMPPIQRAANLISVAALAFSLCASCTLLACAVRTRARRKRRQPGGSTEASRPDASLRSA